MLRSAERPELLLCLVMLLGAGVALGAPEWRPGLGRLAPSGDDTVHGRQRIVFDSHRGVAVAFGGDDEYFENPTNETWEFDGMAWTQGASPPPGLEPRLEYGMTFDSLRGVVVLFGGNNGSVEYDDTWEYDGTGWREFSGTGPGVLWPTNMTFDSLRGVAVVMAEGGPIPWEYDGASWTQGPTGSTGWIPMDICYYRARGVTVITGVPETWEYDGSSWVMATPDSGPPSVTYDSDREIIVGLDYSGGTWEYDGSGWSGPFATGPGASFTYLAYDEVRKRIIGLESPDTYLYRGGAWELLSRPQNLPSKHGSRMAFDQTRAAVVEFGATPDTAELDGLKWRFQVLPGPGVTYGHGMTYDSNRGLVVAFGGGGAQLTKDIWEFDGSGWTSGVPPPAVMTARGGHVQVFDESRGVHVVIGGFDDLGDPLDDTWEFDGGGWATGPALDPGMSVSYWAPAAYQASRGVVMFDSDYSAPQTWVYDGGQFTPGPTTPAGLAQHYGVRLVRDSDRDVLVLYGGEDGINLLSDTWELDATGWSQIPVGPEAPARRGHAMAYAESWGAMVMRGGHRHTGGDLAASSWEYHCLPVLPELAPHGLLGAPYSLTLSAPAGVGPVTYTLAAGSLPPGLTLSGDQLSGVPTEVGITEFVIKGRDAEGCAGSRRFWFRVDCGSLSVDPASLPMGIVGIPYDAALKATGGTASRRFQVMAGRLPPGVVLRPSGKLVGVPTSGGSYRFRVEAVDGNGCRGTRLYTLTVLGLD